MRTPTLPTYPSDPKYEVMMRSGSLLHRLPLAILASAALPVLNADTCISWDNVTLRIGATSEDGQYVEVTKYVWEGNTCNMSVGWETIAAADEVLQEAMNERENGASIHVC